MIGLPRVIVTCEMREYQDHGVGGVGIALCQSAVNGVVEGGGLG